MGGRAREADAARCRRAPCLSFRLSEFGWDAGHWELIQRAYPPTLVHTVADDVAKTANTKVAIVNGDWLAAATAETPLYYALLGLPAKLSEFAKMNATNIDQNIRLVGGPAHRRAHQRRDARQPPDRAPSGRPRRLLAGLRLRDEHGRSGHFRASAGPEIGDPRQVAVQARSDPRAVRAPERLLCLCAFRCRRQSHRPGSAGPRKALRRRRGRRARADDESGRQLLCLPHRGPDPGPGRIPRRRSDAT